MSARNVTDLKEVGGWGWNPRPADYEEPGLALQAR
jgi:hypothetical protein